MRDHLDSPDGVIWVLAALGALVVALAMFGVLDMDDTQTNLDPAPAVYQPKDTTP